MGTLSYMYHVLKSTDKVLRTLDDYERPPSVARSFSLGPRRERGSSIHAEESNIGRERAASISYGHGSQMPWNISYSSAAGKLQAWPLCEIGGCNEADSAD